MHCRKKTWTPKLTAGYLAQAQLFIVKPQDKRRTLQNIPLYSAFWLYGLHTDECSYFMCSYFTKKKVFRPSIISLCTQLIDWLNFIFHLKTTYLKLVLYVCRHLQLNIVIYVSSSAISSLLSENIESEKEEVSDFVGWTRSGENFSTELCRTKFLSSL